MSTSWFGEPIVLPLADAAACAAVRAGVHAARERWTCRVLNGQPPFYTLGAAAYFDLGFLRGSIDDYLAQAGSVRRDGGPAVNALLDAVRSAIERTLAAPVAFATDLPTPGFHIFIGRAIPQLDCLDRRDCGSCHFDLQHAWLPWSRWFERVDADRQVSFTLPISLPRAGGALRYWETVTRDRVGARGDADIGRLASEAPCKSIHYATGCLVLHDGHLLHQMAGVRPVSVDDERITLQGHALHADGAWRLYW